jgi:large subunit ribosomal protein L24
MLGSFMLRNAALSFQTTLCHQQQATFARLYRNPKKFPIIPMPRWRIGVGDTVQVNSGKDKGKIGMVTHLYRKKNRLVVEGVNYKLKRTKAKDQDDNSTSGISTIQHPIHYSNVNLVDPESGKGTKTRYGFLADGTKVRISKSTGTIIPAANREHLTYANRHKEQTDGAMDTPVDKVLEVTYFGEDFVKVRLEFEQYIAEKESTEKLLIFDS